MTELHPDIACIAGSKQDICNPNFEGNTCIRIYV